MLFNNLSFSIFKQFLNVLPTCMSYSLKLQSRNYYKGPFLEFYHQNTGSKLSENQYSKLIKNHPAIETINIEQLKYTTQVLGKFKISSSEACNHIHIFCMNPISVDNYGEILKECGFINISPKHIIHYHTLVRSRTIAQLKKEGLMKPDIKLEEFLIQQLKDFPKSHKLTNEFLESNTSILSVRKCVLKKYLIWRLSISDEEFEKYCRNYLPLKHKPMCDIQDALSLAQNAIGLDMQIIRRNGFIVSADPINTKLILDNVNELSGLDVKEAIRIEPAILKNNYKALLQIRGLLEEFRIPWEAQRRCLKVYCMKPSTVQERLEELRNINEYNILATNPRVLSLVIHKKKMQQRLQRIQNENKQCFSLNLLVSSSKVFNTYISNFGDKVCGRDLGILIGSSLIVAKYKQSEIRKEILKRLRRQKFWLHSALSVIDGNIKFLKQTFGDDEILDNCQLLLYPIHEIQGYVNYFLTIRKGHKDATSPVNLDASYNSLQYTQLTNRQVLSLVLYEIEKKFHFSGDGIWPKQERFK